MLDQIEVDNEAYLEGIMQKIKRRENIGIELISLLEYPKIVSQVHIQSEAVLSKALNSYIGTLISNKEIVFLSLCLIGIDSYDGSFYSNVSYVYEDLYARFSDQKIEGLIRSLLVEFQMETHEKDRTRLINVILYNCIVPIPYLYDFYDFVFDIYKLNFLYDVKVDIDEELRFVFEGIRKHIFDATNDLNLPITKKTYRLIKSTQELIIKNDLTALIKLSSMMLLQIDDFISKKVLIKHGIYFDDTFEQWTKDNSYQKSLDMQESKTVTKRSKWLSRFILKGSYIYLEPPIHRIKDIYDYSKLTVNVFNDEVLIYQNSQMDVRSEIIGGYIIYPENIRLRNPLGKVRYELSIGDEILYDSEQKLYREFIVFSNTGNEIMNYTPYSGNVSVCEECKDSNVYTSKDRVFYKLRNVPVYEGESLTINDHLFVFSKAFKPGIYGEQVKDSFLVRESNNRKIPIFRTAEYFVFESTLSLESYQITMDGFEFEFNDFNLRIEVQSNGVQRFIINLDTPKQGLHVIKVLDKSSRLKLIHSYDFLIDSNFLFSSSDDSKVIRVSVNCILLDSVLERTISIDTYFHGFLFFEYQTLFYYFSLPLSVDIFRIDCGMWRSLKDDNHILMKEVSSNSKIEIVGRNYTDFCVYSNLGNLIINAEHISNKAPSIVIDIGFLNNYKIDYEYTLLVLSEGEDKPNGLYFYNKCAKKGKGIIIDFDPVTKLATITASYYGEGSVKLIVENLQGSKVHTSDQLKDGDRRILKGLKSFTEYLFKLVEFPEGLSMQKPRLVAKTNITFYSWDDMIDKDYRILSCDYFYYNRDIEQRNTYKLQSTFLRIDNKVSEDSYTGTLYVKDQGKIQKLFKVNPVEVCICSNVIDEQLEVSIMNEGDGLLLDYDIQGIANTLESAKGQDIYSYVLDLRKEM